MPVRLEMDTVIAVPAQEPGSEQRRTLELRFAGDGESIVIYAGKYGREVLIADLRDALDIAERYLEGDEPDGSVEASGTAEVVRR